MARSFFCMYAIRVLLNDQHLDDSQKLRSALSASLSSLLAHVRTVNGSLQLLPSSTQDVLVLSPLQHASTVSARQASQALCFASPQDANCGRLARKHIPALRRGSLIDAV